MSRSLLERVSNPTGRPSRSYQSCTDGRYLNGELKTMLRIAALLSIVLYATIAHAEVEWFTSGQSSELLVDTLAQVIPGERTVNCTFAKTREPACVSGPCKQHEILCTPKVLSWSSLSPSTSFSGTAEAKPPPYKKDQGTHHADMSMTSTANQETHFGSLGVSSKNSIATNRVNRGNWSVGTSGHAQSSGDVYFRINDKEGMPYELNGRIYPIGVANAQLGRGMLELIPIRTSGRSDPINISSFSVKSATLANTGRLSPGDYRLHWWIVSDVTSSSGAATLDFDLIFGSARRVGITVAFPKGPVDVIGPDGKKIDITKEGIMSLSEISTFHTGPGGYIALIFPNESILEIGENSQIELKGIDREYLTPPEPTSYIWNALQGLFIWTSGKLAKEQPVAVDTPYGCCGIRGTKVELLVRPNRTGHIKLWKGAVEWRPKDGSPLSSLAPGQMITFDSSGRASAPVPLP